MITSKGRSNKMKKWKLLTYFVIINLIKTAYTAGVTPDGNAVVGGSFTMECVTDSVVGAIQISDPAASIAANCLIPSGTTSNCLPGTDPNYSSSQDVATKTTSVTIGVTARATHEGTWTCTKAGDTPLTTSVTVLTIPTLIVSQTVSALTLSNSNTQSLTITATCAYPAVSLDVYFVPTGGGTAMSSPSSTATCTSTGNTGCADTDANIYNCVIVPKLETSLSAGTYHVQFVVNLAGQYEPIGLNSTITDTVITIEASSSSSICDSCTTTNVLVALGIIFAVVCVALCWKVYFKFSESGGGKGKFKCSVTWCFRAKIIATVVSVIGFILCIAGLIICVTCDDSVSSSNSVTVGFALAVVGFVLAAVTLVIVIILVILFCRGVITKKDDDVPIVNIPLTSYATTEGTTYTIPCSVSSTSTVTSVSWQRTINGRTSPIRIDGVHFSGATTDSPSLNIEASITDSGTYTCFASNSDGTASDSTQLTVSEHNSPNLGDDTTEECVALNSDPLLEEKANNPI